MSAITIHGDLASPLGWQDALAAAETTDTKYVVSSPNVNFIPEPVIGLVKVSLRADCRYGTVDPIQWPQILAGGYEFLCAVLRPIPVNHRYNYIWWTPEEHSDFRLLEGSMFKCLGLLDWDRVHPLGALVDELSSRVGRSPMAAHERLSWLDAAMRHARDRLRYFPSTFRDAYLQVRETQRYWLMCRAFLDYHELYLPAQRGTPKVVNRELMGAFTTDPGLVQKLFNAGVPVWWVRSDLSILKETKIHAVVMPTRPTQVCMTHALGQGHVLYSGLVGAQHISATARGGHTYLDVCRAPLLAVHEDGGYSAPAPQKDYKGLLVAPKSKAAEGSSRSGGVVWSNRPGAHGTTGAPCSFFNSVPCSTLTLLQTPRLIVVNFRGVNKFEEFSHPFMPPTLSSWRSAMTSVDLSNPARPNSEIWGYWIPEPTLLLRPQTTDRRDRYISSWLRLRIAWLYMLRIPDARVTAVPTQWWRDVLYGPTARDEHNPGTLNNKRWEAIALVFGEVFAKVHWDDGAGSRIDWFGYRMHPLNHALCPLVIWELFELGFRYELLVLDRLLVPCREGRGEEVRREELLGRVFPGGALYSLNDLPTAPVGLSATHPHRRAPFLEAFRRVLSCWPRCPSSIHAATPINIAMRDDEIETREKELTHFYARTFFEYSGRAPIVPHQLPPYPDI